MDSQNTPSRELALRIGLAARALPDTDPKRLLNVLADCVGLPITEDKCGSINLTAFKSACAGELSGIDEAVLKKALHILKHPLETHEGPKLTVLDFMDGDMPGSVRIACASNDAVNVDGHFGSCSQFLVYQVSAEQARLIGIRSTDTPDGLEVEDKNAFRAGLISDCQVIYMASVGGPAAAKIVKLGIHPMKLSGVEPIADILAQLQAVIAGTPPPWLAKAMGIGAESRVRFAREATG